MTTGRMHYRTADMHVTASRLARQARDAAPDGFPPRTELDPVVEALDALTHAVLGLTAAIVQRDDNEMRQHWRYTVEDYPP